LKLPENWKPGEIDFCVVRENNEGEYSNIGGRLYEGTDDEIAGATNCLHQTRRESRIAIRLRSGPPKEEACNFRYQVQRHHPHHAFLGRMLPGNR